MSINQNVLGLIFASINDSAVIDLTKHPTNPTHPTTQPNRNLHKPLTKKLNSRNSKNSKITKVQTPDPKDSYVPPTASMVLGNYTTSGAMAQFISTGMVFEDCVVDPPAINYHPGTVVVKFIRDGDVYQQYPSQG